MKFIRYWWHNGLDFILFSVGCVVAFILASSWVHWFVYPRWAGENHLQAFLLVLFFWIDFFVCAVFGWAIVKGLYNYFKELWQGYKKSIK